jgi:16S rRNA (guanine527-N7)-methyltransferase
MPDRSREERAAIARYAVGLGIHLSPRQAEQLQGYLDLLDTWNRKFRLVGTRDRHGLITHHITDSLAVASLAATRSRIIDIGSGAGLPGIPIGIACRDISVTLVESRRRPASFLTEVVSRLDLANVRVREERVEALLVDEAAIGRFDAVTARAWEGLERFLEVSAVLLEPAGIAIAMKGPRADAEVQRLGNPSRTFGTPRKMRYGIEGAKARALLVFERR